MHAIDHLTAILRDKSHGVLVSVIVGAAAMFMSEHYGAPAMLMALLLGMSLNFLSEDGPCAAGIEFTSRAVLRFGVALLGARVSISLVVDLGPKIVALVILAVILTIGFGVIAARLLGRGWRFGVLTGGSVAICGASAAMALSAILPRNEQSEQNLIFTVLSVTLLSTVAMVFYPVLTNLLGFDNRMAGVLLGGTIHDVAQVVGAGFSVSSESGEIATLVKLIRVAMLVPVILTISIGIRRFGNKAALNGERPPFLPVFVLGFLSLSALNSAHFLPNALVVLLTDMSRWALLIAIAAVGMKTSIKRMLNVSNQAIILMIAETIFLLGMVAIGLFLVGF